MANKQKRDDRMNLAPARQPSSPLNLLNPEGNSASKDCLQCKQENFTFVK